LLLFGTHTVKPGCSHLYNAVGEPSRFLIWFPWLILPTFLLHGLLTQGGLVQRLTIMIVLIWVSTLSWHLLRRVGPQDGASPARGVRVGEGGKP
jgi:hypothetical protein